MLVLQRLNVQCTKCRPVKFWISLLLGPDSWVENENIKMGWYTYGQDTASDNLSACLTSAIPSAECLSSAQSSSDPVLISKHLTIIVPLAFSPETTTRLLLSSVIDEKISIPVFLVQLTKTKQKWLIVILSVRREFSCDYIKDRSIYP